MLKNIFEILIKNIQLLTILLIVKSTILAQQYPIRSYSTSDGLVQNTVLSLVQDNLGRIWVGTTGGVSCYDGVNFTNYVKENGLSGVRTYSIYQESEESFWIGSEEGVTNLEFKDGKKIFTSFRTEQGLGTKSTYVILPIKDGFFFAGSGGIFKYNRNTFENILKKYNFPPINIRCGLKDREGNFWFGGEGKLLKLIYSNDNIEIKIYDQNDGISVAPIRNIYQDPKGDIWVSFYTGGLAKFLGDNQQNKLQYFTLQNGLPSNVCYGLVTDTLGNYWLGTNRGVVKFSFQKAKSPDQTDKFEVLQIYDPNNGLSNNNVLPILIDREQNIWFGTHNGLDKLVSERFVNYTTKDKLLSNTVYCTLQDRDGDIWVGTDLGLNLLSDSKTLLVADLEPPQLKERVYSLLEDNAGLIWVSQYTNTVIYQKIKIENKIKLKKVKVFLEGSIALGGVASLAKDKFGHIWIGSSHGVLVYDGQSLQKYTTKDGLSHNFVNSIFIIDDLIWVGTNDGATLIKLSIDGKPEFKTLQVKDGLPAKTIGHILKDSKNNIWFSTEGGGLSKWDGKNFINYTMTDGLSNNVVVHLYEDKVKDAFWIATYNGVSKLEKGKFKNYGYKDGFSQKGSQVFYIMPDKEGNLWFSTNSGLTKYFPALDHNFEITPTLSFTTFKIGQNFLSNQEYKKMVNGNSINLSYEQNNIEIGFLGVSFIDESRINYEYKLFPLDSGWQFTNEKSVKYNNLPSGDYIFQIKATNSNNLSADIKTIKFHIERPYWLRPWFIMLALIFMMGVFYSTYWVRVKSIEVKNQRLEALIQERTNEISEQKRRLEEKNKELNNKNEELNDKNKELLESHKRADRIFSALAEALPGTVLDGKYQLNEKIGSGGFGAVYSGTHLAIKRPIAVKIFRPSQGNDSTEALERFQFEAVSASRINHPNVVAILDSGISTDGIAYLVMELLQGNSLKEELRKKKYLSVGRALEIILPVCDVLSKAHEIGIIHRDIKPDNIFLHQTESGEQVKLIDFGIAKLKQPTENIEIKVLTVTGGIIGTPAYMAPERFEGKCDAKSDVFSIGIVLYEMLGGKVPFQEELGNFYSWIKLSLSKSPEAITELNPTIPEPLAKEIMQTINKYPENRPTTKELAEKLLLNVGVTTTFTTDNLIQICYQLHEKSNLWEELDPAHNLSPEERKILEAETMDLPNASQ